MEGKTKIREALAKIAKKALSNGAEASAIRTVTATLYAAERKIAAEGTILEPANAKAVVAAVVGRPVEGVVDPVYFDLRGRDNPLPATAAKSARSLAVAIRKRRDAGGPLGRWESVAAAASETLGRRVAVAEAKTLYAKGGGDLATSYTGRGTRIGAPGTLGDVAAAVRTNAK